MPKAIYKELFHQKESTLLSQAEAILTVLAKEQTQFEAQKLDFIAQIAARDQIISRLQNTLKTAVRTIKCLKQAQKRDVWTDTVVEDDKKYSNQSSIKDQQPFIINKVITKSSINKTPSRLQKMNSYRQQHSPLSKESFGKKNSINKFDKLQTIYQSDKHSRGKNMINMPNILQISRCKHREVIPKSPKTNLTTSRDKDQQRDSILNQNKMQSFQNSFKFSNLSDPRQQKLFLKSC